MLKNILISFSAVLLLSFTSCGGESSKESKKLLYKIGIPNSIIVNICQDSNRDGICEAKELFTKLTIQKGESIDDILYKILLTTDGRYFLETHNPTLPILLELQDSSKIDYDDGKFTLLFNGFKTKENNESKEISILESMIDNNALSRDIADRFRNLSNQEAQDKYYSMILDVLEKNINTLREKGLDNKMAVSVSIGEMGNEIKKNQEVANKINSCSNDQTCVDKEIKKIFEILILTEDESTQIIEQNASPTENIEKSKWVKVSQSACENNGGRYNRDDTNECLSNWENAKIICNDMGERLPTIEKLSAVISNCGGVIDDMNNINNDKYNTCYEEKGFTDIFYWSSSKVESDSSLAWAVYFLNGLKEKVVNTNIGQVKCIRE